MPPARRLRPLRPIAQRRGRSAESRSIFAKYSEISRARVPSAIGAIKQVWIEAADARAGGNEDALPRPHAGPAHTPGTAPCMAFPRTILEPGRCGGTSVAHPVRSGRSSSKGFHAGRCTQSTPFPHRKPAWTDQTTSTRRIASGAQVSAGALRRHDWPGCPGGAPGPSIASGRLARAIC